LDSGQYTVEVWAYACHQCRLGIGVFGEFGENQGLVCFASYDRFLCLSFMFRVHVVFCFIMYRLPGETRLESRT